jgi:hypothetical protein
MMTDDDDDDDGGKRKAEKLHRSIAASRNNKSHYYLWINTCKIRSYKSDNQDTELNMFVKFDVIPVVKTHTSTLKYFSSRTQFIKPQYRQIAFIVGIVSIFAGYSISIINGEKEKVTQYKEVRKQLTPEEKVDPKYAQYFYFQQEKK